MGKQELVTYDGKGKRIFLNIRGLSGFHRFVTKAVDALIVFEATSTYSRKLETLCRTKHISCYQPNPRVILHLRQVRRKRSKTDSTAAELLYRYGIECGYGEARELSHNALSEFVQARLVCYRVAHKARVAYQA